MILSPLLSCVQFLSLLINIPCTSPSWWLSVLQNCLFFFSFVFFLCHEFVLTLKVKSKQAHVEYQIVQAEGPATPVVPEFHKFYLMQPQRVFKAEFSTGNCKSWKRNLRQAYFKFWRFQQHQYSLVKSCLAALLWSVSVQRWWLEAITQWSSLCIN